MTRDPKRTYENSKRNAMNRGIEWTLSYEQWWALWEASGHWDDYGCRQGGFVLARIDTTKGFHLDNVVIRPHTLPSP